MKKIVLHVGCYLALVLVFTLVLGSSSHVAEQADAQLFVKEIPFLEDWASSPHADEKAEAFIHWNEDDPKEVPVSCAKCHSTPGYQDFIGADGSTVGKVDQPAPIGTVIECAACHNKATLKMDRVVMPSGIEITGLGSEARCMQCHQGRASKFSIDSAIEKANPTDVDTISPDLGFINIHYFAAAATKYGTVAKGGYEYEGNAYDANFAHVQQFNACVECHDQHTLQVRVDECSACHTNVKDVEDLENVRMQGSLVDYDGDGDLEEGIYYELEGLRGMLYQAIQKYAAEKSKTAIVYDAHNHPYFFIDTNNNGKADEDEAKGDNRYNAWTARLLKAAYNYQVSVKDPGAFAHGGKYIIQLVYDSIEDLNAVLSEPIDLKTAHRIDDGHFAGSEEAFRHWDEDGEVPGSCSKCHSASGLPFFLKEGVTASQPLSNGFQCTTCHDDLNKFTRYEVAQVKFPSGAVIDSEDANMNLCMNCHQGRESTVSMNKLTSGIDDNTVSDKLRFLNIHYFAAGATKFGTEVKGGYQYDGKEYVGLFKHVPNYAGCTSCHSTHELKVKEDTCTMCHQQVKEGKGLEAIRLTAPDYDGDGNTEEGVAEELESLRETLYAALRDYAKTIVKSAIVYDSHNYPYFFNDTNGNGQADADEAKSDNRYNTWTPKLLRAAYNYQYVTKDPGGYAHNGKYIAQLLYDGLESLGTDVTVNMTGMVRP